MNKCMLNSKTDGYEKILAQFLENLRQNLLGQIQRGLTVTLEEHPVFDPIREFEGQPVVEAVFCGHIFCAHFGAGEVTISHQ